MAKNKRSRRVRVGALAGLVFMAGVVELAPVSVFGLQSKVLPVEAIDEGWLDAPAAFGDPFFLDAPLAVDPVAKPADEFLDPAFASLDSGSLDSGSLDSGSSDSGSSENLAEPARPLLGGSAPDAVADPVNEILEKLLTP